MTAARATPRQRAIADTQRAKAILDAFVEAMEPVIRDYLARGLREHGAIAEALNRRGVPCWGRSRWHATDIRMVLRHSVTGEELPSA
jgi:hypothetical protein